MINRVLKFSTLFLLVLFVAWGDDKNEGPDTTAPSVMITTPAEGRVYYRGRDLPLNAVFTDNKALKNCVVTIEYFGKVQSAAASLKGVGSPWTPAKSIEYEQEGYPFTIALEEVKEDVVTIGQMFDQAIEGACLGGNYTLTFVTSDMEGNTSEETVNIVIE